MVATGLAGNNGAGAHEAAGRSLSGIPALDIDPFAIEYFDDPFPVQEALREAWRGDRTRDGGRGRRRRVGFSAGPAPCRGAVRPIVCLRHAPHHANDVGRGVCVREAPCGELCDPRQIRTNAPQTGR